MSLPESQFSPRFEEDDEDSLEDSMTKLQEFLFHLGLQKYYEVFEQHEIGFRARFFRNSLKCTRNTIQDTQLRESSETFQNASQINQK